jgi:hypothetical protein
MKNAMLFTSRNKTEPEHPPFTAFKKVQNQTKENN